MEPFESIKIRNRLSEGFMSLARQCNNFNTTGSASTSHPFHVDGRPVGWIRRDVWRHLKSFSDIFHTSGDHPTEPVVLSGALSTYDERSEALSRVFEHYKTIDVFPALRKWRNECYNIYHSFNEPPLMNLERSAACLLGVREYGVHVNCYTRHPERGFCLWLGRRSDIKTWPGCLDSMAAGGLTAGLGVTQCMVNECQEEAMVPDELLEDLKPAGTVTHAYEDERGIFRHCNFVYDLEVPADWTPVNADGEVSEFILVTMEEVSELIITDEFKYTSAFVVLDFLIRRGFIRPDTEPNYTTLLELIHSPV